MNGAEVELLHIQCVPQEWERKTAQKQVGDFNKLSYLPEALVMRALGATWVLPESLSPHMPQGTSREGIFVLRPSETYRQLTK